jgi:hypothetical protein
VPKVKEACRPSQLTLDVLEVGVASFMLTIQEKSGEQGSNTQRLNAADGMPLAKKQASRLSNNE